MLQDNAHVHSLSSEFGVPSTDILMIALNACGLKSEKKVSNRIRTVILPASAPEYNFFAMVCVNTRDTPYTLTPEGIQFNKTFFATIKDFEEDPAELSYFRRKNTAWTLNTNRRTHCMGCDFCGATFQDERKSTRLLDKKALENYFKHVMLKQGFEDLSHLKEIAINTGLFPSEKLLFNHILNVYEVAKSYGFKGELKYLGLQLQSDHLLEEVANKIPKFSYYLTLELFSRPHIKFAEVKTTTKINSSKQLMIKLVDLGFDTTFLYILGLEPLDFLDKGLLELKDTYTRFPVVNIFQTYHPLQEKFRIPEAKKIEYYLAARKILEKHSKKSMRPKLWENYRGLWYTNFSNEVIKNVKLQTFARAC